MEAISLKPGEFLVLAALHKAPLHGYGLSQAISALTKERVRLRPGNLYRVLERMEARGLIEPDAKRRAAGEDRRANYRMTAQGRRALVAEAKLLGEIVRGLLE